MMNAMLPKQSLFSNFPLVILPTVNSLLAILLLIASLAAPAAEMPLTLPFASDFSSPARYNRASAHVATSAAPTPAQFAALAQAGFFAVIDLRLEQEGTAEAALAAAAAGLEYHALPVGRSLPDKATLAQFEHLLAIAPTQSVLVYCASGNRAGTLWAMHRIAAGLPIEAAIDEGLAAGMASERAAWLEQWANEQSH